MTADDLRKAYNEGRQAAVGTVNPYSGKGLTARAWLIGYHVKLVELLNTPRDTGGSS